MALKQVRALRNGSYDGHRRRKGALFVVDAAAKEAWFEDAGEAPEGAELPGSNVKDAQVKGGGKKSFISAMQELGKGEVPSTKLADQKPMTLKQAVDSGESLV